MLGRSVLSTKSGVGLGKEPSMKIGILSDTHLSKPTEELTQIVQSVFSDVDLILHAGDLVELDILTAVGDKEVIAVHGNMDSPECKRALPEWRILDLGGFRVGLIHGFGAPLGIEKRLLSRFAGEPLNVLVFGHTHHPTNRVADGILLFNPGAFAGSWTTLGKRSVGLLMLEDTPKGNHISI